MQALQLLFNQAVSLHEKRPDEAERCYLAILEKQPSHADSWNNLALLYKQLHEHEQLIALIERASAHIDVAPLVLILAEALFADELWQASASMFQEYHLLTAYRLETLSLQGKCNVELERYDQAFDCYQLALQHFPESAIPYARMASLCVELGEYQQATVLIDQSLQIQPKLAEALMIKAMVCRYLDQWAEAARLLEEALTLAPSEAGIWCDYGIVLQGMQELEPAIAAFDKALAISPHHALSHWNKSLVQLQLGQFQAGWLSYEWRWRAGINGQLPDLSIPRWQGEPLAGQKILVIDEQGLGDCLQFLRYLTPLLATEAQVFVSLPESLRRLVEMSWPTIQWVFIGDRASLISAENISCFVPIMDLPRWLDAGQPLRNIPYFSVAAEMTEKWSRLISAHQVDRPALQVGLVWQGSRRVGFARSEWLDNRRSIPLDAFQSLLTVPNVKWHTLQVGSADNLHFLERSNGIDLTGQIQDFADTAAYLMQLDIIVAVDTSVAHIAAALGKPVLLLNRFDTDWRWGKEAGSSPWYCSITEARQRNHGEWQGPLSEVEAEIRQLSKKN